MAGRGGKKKIGNANEPHDRRLSKALSWLLRHHIELTFKHFQSDDTEGEREEALSTGYVDIQALLKMDKFRGFSLEDVKKVVELNDKQRFSLKQRSKDGAWMIRANQGHTIRGIDPDLRKLEGSPDCDIVHGTYSSKLAKIFSSGGLSRMSRNHIHFSKGLPGPNTNVISGMRQDCDILFYVDFVKSTQAGFEFFESANGVILCSGNEKGILPVGCFEKIVQRKTGEIVPIPRT